MLHIFMHMYIITHKSTQWWALYKIYKFYKDTLQVTTTQQH